MGDMYSDDYCAICMQVMVEPVTLECGHSFCSICVKNCIGSKNFYKFCCPLDRTKVDEHFKIEVNMKLKAEIKESHKIPFMKRENKMFKDKEWRLNDKSYEAMELFKICEAEKIGKPQAIV